METDVIRQDIEILKNYSLFALKDSKTLELITFEVKGKSTALTTIQVKKLAKYLYSTLIVTFNGNKYDGWGKER